MKITNSISARMFVLSLILVACPSLVKAEAVAGQVKNVIGDATVILPNGKHEQITTDTTIPAGSKIQTGPDSRLVVQWMPGALSVITSSAAVAVSSLNYSDAGGAPQRKVALNLTQGSVFSHLAHNSGTSDFHIKTPTAVAAARGTDWEVTVHGHNTTVSVVSSAVDVSLPADLHITVKAGYVYSVTAGGEPVALTQDELNEIVSILEQAGIHVGQSNVGQVYQHGTHNLPLDETPITKGGFNSSN